MIINLKNATPIRESGGAHRPFTLSVEADIPQGTFIEVGIECLNLKGQIHKQAFQNPNRQVIPTPFIHQVSFVALDLSGSLATPFIYSLIIEGNGWRYIYDAQTLFDAREEQTPADQPRLMQPQIIKHIDRLAPVFASGDGEKLRPYLGWAILPGAIVTACNIQKPLMVELDGGGESDTYISVELSGESDRGLPWSHVIEARGEQSKYPVRQILPVFMWRDIHFNLRLTASSDGDYAPYLEGIALEGDGRRYYLSVAEICGDEPVQEPLELIRFDESSASVLTLKGRIADEFFGFPSVLDALDDMFERGDLIPDAYRREQPE